MAFVECDNCGGKPGSPELCGGCLANRKHIADLTDALYNTCKERDTARKRIVELERSCRIMEAAHLKAIERQTQAEHDVVGWRDSYKGQLQIVEHIWEQLGSPTYEELEGKSIYDCIDQLKDRPKAAVAERNRLREYTEHKQSCLVHTAKGDTELTEEECCTCGLSAALRGEGE